MLGRSEHRQAPLAKMVHQPIHQRRFRPHDGQIDLLVACEGEERRNVVGFNGDAFGLPTGQAGFLRDARVAGGAPQALDLGTLGQTINDGVLAAARTDDKYFHKDL